MANTRETDKILMAQLLANLVLYFPTEINKLLSEYGVNATNMNPSDRLSEVEKLIQSDRAFANRVVNMIGVLGGTPPPRIQYVNAAKEIGEGAGAAAGGVVAAIGNALAGITSGVAGIIDASSSATQEAKKTAAQAALLNAQAQIEQAKANQIAAGRKQNLFAIVGVSVAGLVLAIGIFAYFRFRNKNKQ